MPRTDVQRCQGSPGREQVSIPRLHSLESGYSGKGRGADIARRSPNLVAVHRHDQPAARHHAENEAHSLKRAGEGAVGRLSRGGLVRSAVS